MRSSSTLGRLLLQLMLLQSLGDAPPLTMAFRTAHAPDMLQPVFDWNRNLHPVMQYQRTIIHDACPITGYVRVQSGVEGSRPHFKDTPKEYTDAPG
eukprot:SAG22_NODE_5651_length_978_cov_0.725825_1_plen_95_part_10